MKNDICQGVYGPMSSDAVEEVLSRTTDMLLETGAVERMVIPSWEGPLPSVKVLEEIIENIKTIIFPDFFDRLRGCRSMSGARLAVSLDKLMRQLAEQLTLCFNSAEDGSAGKAAEVALAFIGKLPEIKRLLYTDVRAVFDNDPAASNFGEVILSYPVVKAMINYRVAHELVLLGVPVLPRILTELAHSETGIDINPGATIGEYFAIDHGTGVVIGETCVIGKHVTIYQGVTLGAKKFTLDRDGRPVNEPRHPILEDNVTVYANSTVLGRVTVGHDTVIGGNVWLTESVPPFSKIVQQRADAAIITR